MAGLGFFTAHSPAWYNQPMSSFRWAGISMFFHHPLVFRFIPHHLAGWTIVDGGCGKGIYGFLLRATRDLSHSRLIGLDISQSYLQIAKHHRVYDRYLVASLDQLPFPNQSIDLFLAVEVIAHLEKSSGKKFLTELDRVCTRQTIVVTPNALMHRQPEFISSDSHHSSWTVADFTCRGFTVYGFGLRLPPPSRPWQVPPYFALQYIFTPLTYFFPFLAGYLIAVKNYVHS